METLPCTSPANSHQASLLAPLPSTCLLRGAARQVLHGCRGQRVPTSPRARIRLLRHTGKHLPCRAGPSSGILSAASRGSCPHPDKCWAPHRGVGVSVVLLHPPGTTAVDQSVPWDTHSGMSVMSKSWLFRKMLQPGKTGNNHHKEGLLESNPSPSGKWGVLRPPTSPLGQLRDASRHSWSSKTPALYTCHTGSAPGLTKGK